MRVLSIIHGDNARSAVFGEVVREVYFHQGGSLQGLPLNQGLQVVYNALFLAWPLVLGAAVRSLRGRERELAAGADGPSLEGEALVTARRRVQADGDVGVLGRRRGRRSVVPARDQDAVGADERPQRAQRRRRVGPALRACRRVEAEHRPRAVRMDALL